jgi:hypothetical protein
LLTVYKAQVICNPPCPQAMTPPPGAFSTPSHTDFLLIPQGPHPRAFAVATTKVPLRHPRTCSLSSFKYLLTPDTVAHSSNPSYLGIRDQKSWGSKPALGK